MGPGRAPDAELRARLVLLRRWLTAALAVALLACCAALSGAARAADIVLRASVGPDLQTIQGTLRLEGHGAVRWVDLLSALPDPETDADARRTWPNGPERGHVHWTGDRDLAFHTVVPRRYDAAGLVPGHGLFLNGLWYPQAVVEDRAPTFEWDVEITLPDGTLGVLNGVIDRGVVRWTGRAERLALAVLPRARVSARQGSAGELVLVDQGPARHRRDRHLQEILEGAWPQLAPGRVVVVETPSRKRLVRPGPGVLFLSDRALRLTGPLWRYHAAATRRGLLESALPLEDPFERAFVAAALSDAISAEATPRELLGWLAWIPPIDALLYDGTLPFYAETFDETHPDPVHGIHDDLLELVGDEAPARSVTRRLDAKYGGGTARAIAWRLLEGDGLADAASAVGISAADLAAWRRPCPDQDLTLAVGPTEGGGWAVTVTREAPADAPPELVALRIDDQDETWETTPGSDETTVAWPTRPQRVALDPDGLVHQTDRAGERWPVRWNTILSAWVYELDLRSGRVRGFADAAFRRQYDTRNVFGAGLETTPENLVSASVWAVRSMGPLLNRRSRPIRLGLAVGPSLLDPNYRPTDAGAVSVDAATWAVFETRNDMDLPQRGARAWWSNSGGFIPGGGQWWGASGLGGTALTPLSGRLVLAGTARGGVALGAIEHRQLDLGGSGSVQGVAPGVALGDRKAMGAVELRWQALRNASVPLAAAWLSDVQLSVGAEGGALRQGVGAHDQGAYDLEAYDSLAYAAGWTAGAALVFDVLGARPTLIGLWAAHPVVWAPDPLVTSPWPSAYLRFDQPF